jgi:uncharacterized membrane protein (UPF0127 family)
MGAHIRFVFFIAGAVLLTALIYIDIPESVSSTNTEGGSASSTVQLKDRTIAVDVADTLATRERGLSGREGLGEDEGMLFVFPEDARYSFWMKDMRFSIDILWVSREGAIVDIREKVSPETYPTVFQPSTEARYVIELPAGWTTEHDVKIGDTVRLPGSVW